MQSPSSESIECPLCSGAGELSRAEILDRLGVKDFARVAQLSAEEAFRLLEQKHRSDEQSAWSRFETELAKRTADIREQHKDALRLAMSEKETLARRVEDCLRELAEVRERNQELEGEMSKAARIGKLEEMTFEEEARTWAGVWVSDKLPRNGDYILSYRAQNGDPVEPRILIDNKDKSTIAESDIDKLVRDARERSIQIAALVAREEHQLRQVDRDSRWSRNDGIWLLRTTRQWIVRDLDLLKPIFERMRVQGFDLLEQNAVLAEELRRTFPEIDRIEKELGKAAKAIQSVSALVVRYRNRLRDLCETAISPKKEPTSERRHVALTGGAMSIQELARYYLSQGKTVRAAALMMTLTETEPTSENLTLLADIYMKQGLFDDARALYLRVVKAELNEAPMHEETPGWA